MTRKNRYAILTVDTEALPRRAPKDHVQRLMWGQFDNGRAGVAEMAAIGNEFGVKHLFFMDLCGAYAQLEEELEVVRWLDADGQDVQLHGHPEYLPKSFWDAHQLPYQPRYMNQYTDDKRSEFVLKYFSNLIQNSTGKPILAHRAGSFRWNASTLRALKSLNIPLSFNNSTSAMYVGQCPYSVATNEPFMWSNGIIEIPVTEKKILPKVGKPEWWARLTYPESPYFRFCPWWGKFLFNTVSGSPDFAVFLLHSWSLLYRNEQGHAEYRDDQLLERYRKLLSRLTKNYEVLTSPDLLELITQGKIKTTHSVDIAHAKYQPKKKK